MRIETEQTLAFRRRVLSFSKREQETLRRAAVIAENARELMREELGEYIAEDHYADLLLGEIFANVDELLTDGIELSAVESLAFSF